MKKLLLISFLLVVSPIFSMSRALRRAASLARRPIARTTSTSVSKNSPIPKLTPLRVGVGSLIAVWGTRVAIDKYISYSNSYSDEQLLASLENHPPASVGFITAISKSSSEVIQRLLDEDTSGTLVNATDQFANSALTVACVRGNAEIVKVLLDNGADVKEDSTPLIVALLNKDVTIAKMLIEEGANVEKIGYNKNFDKLQLPPKTFEARDKALKMLCETIRGYDHSNCYGHSNFMFSDVSNFLFDRAWGVRQPYGIGEKARYTPLSVAAAWASSDIIQLLIDNGANVKTDPFLLKVAVNRANPEILNILLNNGADVKTDPSLLVLVARHSYYRSPVKIARTLLEQGANPNTQDKNGNTPLMLATQSNSVAMVDVLSKYGADVNTRDQNGMTPLMWISRCSNWLVRWNGSYYYEKEFLKLVDLLSKYGADINTRDRDGLTPLMWASRRGLVPMVETLVAHGADLNAKDKQGLTAWDWAINKGHLETAEIFVAHSVDLQGASVNELT